MSLPLTKSPWRKRRYLPRMREAMSKIALMKKQKICPNQSTQTPPRLIVTTALSWLRCRSPNPRRMRQTPRMQKVQRDNKKLPGSPKRNKSSKMR
jgi:hypothetical protein